MYITFLIGLGILLLLGLIFGNAFFRGANGEWILRERMHVLEGLFSKKKQRHKPGSDKAGRKGA